MSTSREAFVLGVDLGGTKIIAAAADLDGTILAEIERPTWHGPDTPAIDQIVALTRELAAGLESTPDRFVQACIGVPGSVSPKTGLVSLAPNVALPTDRPLAPLLAERIGCPVDIENDVNVAAFGEAHLPERRQYASLAFLSFGTGIGCGLIIDGHLVRGANGAAGEIAYLPVGATPHAAAGSTVGGLFEDTVSSSAIRARHSESGLSVASIFERAGAGDERAIRTIEATAKAASIGVAAIASILDPDLIVLGGSIGARPEFAEAVRRHANVLIPLGVALETSRLDRRAGIEGAVRVATEAARQRMRG